MDNILQQSGNLQVVVVDDDDDDVNIEYVSTASAAQAICNICNRSEERRVGKEC